MDKEKIISLLDACLLRDAELNLGKNEWEKFADPFPHWELKVDL